MAVEVKESDGQGDAAGKYSLAWLRLRAKHHKDIAGWKVMIHNSETGLQHSHLEIHNHTKSDGKDPDDATDGWAEELKQEFADVF